MKNQLTHLPSHEELEEVYSREENENQDIGRTVPIPPETWPPKKRPISAWYGVIAAEVILGICYYFGWWPFWP